MTREEFMKAVADNPGVELDIESEINGDNLILDSPKGKVFSANGIHCMVEPYRNNGGQSWKPEAYANLAVNLEMGLRECEIEDCDHCDEMGGQ